VVCFDIGLSCCDAISKTMAEYSQLPQMCADILVSAMPWKLAVVVAITQ